MRDATTMGGRPNRRAGAIRSPRRALLARTALASASVSVWLLAGSAAALPGGVGGPGTAPITVQPSGGGVTPTTTNVVGTTMTVTPGGPRVIIDWKTFNIDQGETVQFLFNGKNWIALNRVQTGSATIDGNLFGCLGSCPTYGGNIWIYAPDGVVFGSHAVVNTGGLLATTANLAGADSSFVNSTDTTTFAFSGSSANSAVTIASGAHINSSGGTLAFVAPTVTNAGSVVANTVSGSSVLYGATNGFQIAFKDDGVSNLDLVSFTIPVGSGSTPTVNGQKIIDLSGATLAGNIYVAAVNQNSLVNALISVSGQTVATGSGIVDGDIVLYGAGAAAGVSQASGASLSSGGGAGTVGISLTGTQISADNTILLNASGAISGEALTAGGTVDAQSDTDIDFTGVVTANDLTGRAGGHANFGTTASPVANQIVNLGAFSTGTGFSLTDARTLTVDGVVSSGSGALKLAVSGAGSDLVIQNTLDASGQNASLTAAHDITESGSGSVLALGLTTSSGGSTTLSSLSNAIGSASFTAGGDYSLTDSTGVGIGGTAGGSVSVGAGAITVGSISSGTSTQLTSSGSITGGSITAGTLIGLNAASAINMAGALIAPSLTTSSGGSTTLSSLSNAIGSASFTAGGNYSLTDSTAVGIGGTAGGSVSVGAGAITVGSISSGTSTQLTSSGSITGGSITAGTQIGLNAASNINMAGALVAPSLTTSSGGSTTLGSLSNAIGSASFTAGGNYSLIDSTAVGIGGTAGGSVSVGAGAITVGSISSGTSTQLTSSGSITGGSITAGTQIGLNAASNINMAGALVAPSLTTSSGGSTTLGSLSNAIGSASFTAGGDYSLIDSTAVGIGGTAGGSVSVGAGTITVGSISSGTSTQLTSSGSITGGSITAGTQIGLNAASNINMAGALVAPSLTTSSGGSTTLGSLSNAIGTASFTAGGNYSLIDSTAVGIGGTAGGSVSVGAGAITVGSISSGTSTQLTSSGSITGGSITAGTQIGLNAASNINMAGALVAPSLTTSSGGSTTLGSLSNAIGTASFTAGGDYSLTDSTGVGIGGTAGGSVSVNAGDITVGSISSGTSTQLTSSGSITGGSITAGTLIGLNAASNINMAGALVAPSLTTSSGGSTTLSSLSNAIGSASFTAGGDYSLTDSTGVGIGGTAGGSVSVGAGTITVGSISSGTSTQLTSSGSITGGSITAGTQIGLNAASNINMAGALVAPSLTTSSGGSTTLGSLSNAIGSASFTAGGNYSLIDSTGVGIGGTAGGSVSVGAGDITVGSISSGTSTQLTSSGSITGGSITAGTQIGLNAASTINMAGALIAPTLTTSSGGSTTLGSLSNAIGSASFTAGGDYSLTDSTGVGIGGTAGGSVSVGAGAITVGSISSGTSTQLTSSGSITGGSITAGTQIGLNAASNINMAGALVAPSLTTSSGGSTTLSSLSNAIGTASFTAGGNYSLIDSTGVGIGGTAGGSVSVGAGAITVGSISSGTSTQLTSSGSITGGSITAGTFADLRATGDIDFTGVVTASDLTGRAGGHAKFSGANRIATLDAFKAGTGFALTNAQGLTVSGADIRSQGFTGVSATTSGDVYLRTTAGNLSLAGDLTTGGSTAAVELISDSGNIAQSGGVITSANLTGSSVAGSTTLNQANRIATLDAFKTGTGFALTNAQGLTVSGADIRTLGFTGVGATTSGDVYLRTTAGNLSLAGDLTTGGATAAVELISDAGNIAQSGGVITSANLTGSSVQGSTALNQANRIATLDAFKTGTGFALTNAQGLTVSGTDIRTQGFTGVSATTSGDLSIATTSGALVIGTGAAGTPMLSASNVSLSASGTGAQIFMGDSDFVTAATSAAGGGSPGAVNVLRGNPRNGNPTNYIFVKTTGTLSLNSTGYILQQNQSKIPGQGAGILAKVVQIGGSPLAIDLFGSIVDGQNVISGPDVALDVTKVTFNGVARSNNYRFNGCVIGQSGVCTVLDTRTIDVEPQLLAEELLLQTSPQSEDVDPTITGSGNEEIWRKRKK